MTSPRLPSAASRARRHRAADRRSRWPPGCGTMRAIMNYSSKDFGRTKAALGVELPEKLAHRGLAHNGPDAQFSPDPKPPVFVVDLPSKVLSMTIGGLAPQQSTNRHRHTYETIIYVL